MALVLTASPPPLALDVDGVARVAGTRVTLDTMVAAFREGATPEEIAQQYPVLDLADIYAVITYALQHPADVEAYLREQQELALRVRRNNEARWDPAGIRDRLLSRQPAGRPWADHAADPGEPSPPAISG